MTDKTIPFDDLLKMVEKLSPEQKRIIRLRLDDTELPIETLGQPPEEKLKPRVPDLFPGIWTSDDFDDPLPDEFWLGEDA